MKYNVGDVLKYPGNGITWKVIQVKNPYLEVELVDKGTSNHPYNIGKIHEYHLNDWKLFKIISFNAYLRRL